MNILDEIMLYIDSHGRIWSPAGGEGILYIRKALHDEQIAERDRIIRECERMNGKMAEDIQALRAEIIPEKDKRIAEFIIDEGVDDIAIRELALKVLSNEEVDGDTYGVPDIVTIVERLVKRIRVLERALEMYDENRLVGTLPAKTYIEDAEAEKEKTDGNKD